MIEQKGEGTWRLGRRTCGVLGKAWFFCFHFQSVENQQKTSFSGIDSSNRNCGSCHSTQVGFLVVLTCAELSSTLHGTNVTLISMGNCVKPFWSKSFLIISMLAGLGCGGSSERKAVPVAKDGVLFILTRNRIWAFQEGAQSDPL